MTEDITELQRLALSTQDARTLFVLGKILEAKQRYMDQQQIETQIKIRALFANKTVEQRFGR